MTRRPSTAPATIQPATLTAARVNSRFLLLGAGLMFLCGNVLAQDDDYLLELEGAMEEVSPITDNPPSIVQDNTPAAPAVAPQQSEFLDQVGAEIEGMESPGSEAVPENARDQFDSDLQDRMPGTFVLYNRLSDEGKTEVFSEYEMSGDYLRVRRKIIELRRSN